MKLMQNKVVPAFVLFCAALAFAYIPGESGFVSLENEFGETLPVYRPLIPRAPWSVTITMMASRASASVEIWTIGRRDSITRRGQIIWICPAGVSRMVMTCGTAASLSVNASRLSAAQTLLAPNGALISV